MAHKLVLHFVLTTNLYYIFGIFFLSKDELSFIFSKSFRNISRNFSFFSEFCTVDKIAKMLIKSYGHSTCISWGRYWSRVLITKKILKNFWTISSCWFFYRCWWFARYFLYSAWVFKFKMCHSVPNRDSRWRKWNLRKPYEAIVWVTSIHTSPDLWWQHTIEGGLQGWQWGRQSPLPRPPVDCQCYSLHIDWGGGGVIL